MVKVIFKSILFILTFLALVYVALAFIEGGFGKKPATTLPVKDKNALLLFAHRGVTTGFPENSRESIEQAKKLQFKGLEIDIRKTADNKFILFHDENARRLLGQDTLISELTLSQIRQYNLLINNDTTGAKVFTLNEMLEDYRGDFIIYFDMKLGNLNDIDDLVQMIWSYDISRSVILASASLLVVLYVEYNYPAIQTAMEGFNSGNEWTWYLIPKKLKPDFLSGFASKVDEKHVEWLQKQDLLSTRIVYGVDSTNYQSMLDLGIRNMIIDYYPALQVP